jgi:hypothetical protein
MIENKYIGWFSCGITSAVACKLAVEQYGKDDVKLYYIGIKSAHPDNDRFIKECESWIGIPIEIVSNKKYIDQFDVIEHTKYINGPSGARCTKELKKNVRFRIESEHNYPHQIFGFEYSLGEINRALRFRQQYPMAKPIFPLITNKITKENAAFLLNKAGIDLPTMYKLGFHNNNCIGCVKGGKGYWNKIREHFPEVFEQMSELEQEIGRSCIKNKFLKDLTVTEGKHEPPILPDCGTFCEVKFADIIDPLALEIYENPFKINLTFKDNNFF